MTGSGDFVRLPCTGALASSLAWREGCTHSGFGGGGGFVDGATVGPLLPDDPRPPVSRTPVAMHAATKSASELCFLAPAPRAGRHAFNGRHGPLRATGTRVAVRTADNGPVLDGAHVKLEVAHRAGRAENQLERSAARPAHDVRTALAAEQKVLRGHLRNLPVVSNGNGGSGARSPRSAVRRPSGAPWRGVARRTLRPGARPTPPTRSAAAETASAWCRLPGVAPAAGDSPRPEPVAREQARSGDRCVGVCRRVRCVYGAVGQRAHTWAHTNCR